MPKGNTLTPLEAAQIATNVYFTLDSWIHFTPRANTESMKNIQNRVLGNASVGSPQPGSGRTHVNSSLKGGGLGSAQIANVHSATTGVLLTQTSGFGYTLSFQGDGSKHVVIATRGTRPEMNAMPDLVTDLRATMRNYGDYGPVHTGFLKTYESIAANLDRDKALIESADVIHCVGHSLGGAIATLIAGRYAGSGKKVKLYTFGCPRVGAGNTYLNFERRIGVENIHRVSHDLDPVTLIGPYPFIHIQPRFDDRSNLILPSRSGSFLTAANHDMDLYIQSAAGKQWSDLRLEKAEIKHKDDILASWLLRDDNTGWVRYACVKTLSYLFRLFRSALRVLSTAVVLGLSMIDVVAEILIRGLHLVGQFSKQLLQLLEHTAYWATGIRIKGKENFTSELIRELLEKMFQVVKTTSIEAIGKVQRNIKPVALSVGTTWALSSFNVI